MRQVFPDVAALLNVLPPQRQAQLVRQLALEALHRAGGEAPPPGDDLAEWSDAMDTRGWSRDAEGEWRQSEDDFTRARAAFALRHAADAGSREGAAEDSLYECIAALGPDVVQERLRLVT